MGGGGEEKHGRDGRDVKEGGWIDDRYRCLSVKRFQCAPIKEVLNV